MLTIAITGASGFIGQHLINFFNQKGYNIVTINRNQLNGNINLLSTYIDGAYAVIHLAGTNILKRWNKKNRQIILNSRTQTTKNLVNAINICKQKPKLLISTSAVGIYDSFHIHTENSTNYDNNFLAEVCTQWEEATQELHPQTRKIIFRLGVVLHPSGGVLAKMLPAFKWGLGGIIGNGKQAFPYITMTDLLNAYEFVIKTTSISGIINLVAPEIITNAQFTNTLAKSIKRSTFFNIPTWILKIILGQAHIVLSSGQKVIPEKLINNNFKFQYPNLESFLKMSLAKT